MKNNSQTKLYSDDELLMLSGIQHYAFCPRQWALIHIELQWQENLFTFKGREMHERVDEPNLTEMRGTVLITRSLPIVSFSIGMYGVADVVEFNLVEDYGITIRNRKGLWMPFPVEYKVGKPKSDERDLVQLCAQAICLEEMFGIIISEGAMFYGKTRRRLDVEFDEKLRTRVTELSKEMHSHFKNNFTPKPVKTKACQSCSLIEICLPELQSKKDVKRYYSTILNNLK